MKTKPIALITGATGGIGEATAYRLQGRDYEVFATGRNPEALDALRSRGLRARTLDVTDEDAVARLVEEIDTDYGGVDVLVNNAGFGFASPLEQAALSDLRSIFETNVVAMLHLSQAVLPAMRARGAGTIVNIGSTGGRFTTPGAGAYHISKYSVEALSHALRAEVKQFGVRVVLIEPTGVRTRSSSKPSSAQGGRIPMKIPTASSSAATPRSRARSRKCPSCQSTPTLSPARLSGRSRPKTPSPAISSGRLGRPPCSLDCS